MNKVLITTAIALTLTACTTPKTTLTNEKTGQVVTCGGNTTSSWMGGAIGYHIQKGDDEECVKSYQDQGFAVTGKTE